VYSSVLVQEAYGQGLQKCNERCASLRLSGTSLEYSIMSGKCGSTLFEGTWDAAAYDALLAVSLWCFLPNAVLDVVAELGLHFC
jgi:hypothetical protein